MNPTLHKPIPMNTRVMIPSLNNQLGTVVGIASMHVIFTYIVLLDVPIIDKEYGEFKAVTIHGTQLLSEDGLSNWKLEE